MWWAENNFVGSILFFHLFVSFGDQTQVCRSRVFTHWAVSAGCGCGDLFLSSLHLGGRGRQMSLNFRAVWSILEVPGHPSLHSEALYENQKQTQNNH